MHKTRKSQVAPFYGLRFSDKIGAMPRGFLATPVLFRVCPLCQAVLKLFICSASWSWMNHRCHGRQAAPFLGQFARFSVRNSSFTIERLYAPTSAVCSLHGLCCCHRKQATGTTLTTWHSLEMAEVDQDNQCWPLTVVSATALTASPHSTITGLLDISFHIR